VVGTALGSAAVDCDMVFLAITGVHHHHVGAHSVFCCPYCGLVADRDAQAAKNILGHGLSVLRDSSPGLYKTCVDETRLAVSAPGVASRTVAVA
jgi:transposase